MNKYLPTIVMIILLANGCTRSFVKDPEINALNEKYNGVYLVKTDIDVGNEEQLKAGARVRIYVLSSHDAIKVYAYDVNEPREEAVGNNIIYLFKADFPDKKFDETVFEEKIDSILQKTK